MRFQQDSFNPSFGTGDTQFPPTGGVYGSMPEPKPSHKPQPAGGLGGLGSLGSQPEDGINDVGLDYLSNMFRRRQQPQAQQYGGITPEMYQLPLAPGTNSVQGWITANYPMHQWGILDQQGELGEHNLYGSSLNLMQSRADAMVDAGLANPYQMPDWLFERDLRNVAGMGPDDPGSKKMWDKYEFNKNLSSQYSNIMSQLGGKKTGYLGHNPTQGFQMPSGMYPYGGEGEGYGVGTDYSSGFNPPSDEPGLEGSNSYSPSSPQMSSGQPSSMAGNLDAVASIIGGMNPFSSIGSGLSGLSGMLGGDLGSSMGKSGLGGLAKMLGIGKSGDTLDNVRGVAGAGMSIGKLASGVNQYGLEALLSALPGMVAKKGAGAIIGHAAGKMGDYFGLDSDSTLSKVLGAVGSQVPVAGFSGLPGFALNALADPVADAFNMRTNEGWRDDLESMAGGYGKAHYGSLLGGAQWSDYANYNDMSRMGADRAEIGIGDMFGGSKYQNQVFNNRPSFGRWLSGTMPGVIGDMRGFPSHLGFGGYDQMSPTENYAFGGYGMDTSFGFADSGLSHGYGYTGTNIGGGGIGGGYGYNPGGHSGSNYGG